MLSLALALVVTGVPTPAPLSCPADTARQERTTAEAGEIWCERADGLRHGPRHAFYADGARWFEGEYAEGKRSGLWRFWYPSGALRSEGTYRADKRHGKSEHFHDGAGKAMAGSCQDGVEVGLWIRWNPSGRKEIEIDFGAAGQPGRRAYYSRRGRPVDLDAFVREKARGATPGSPRFDKEKKRYGTGRFFSECGS